MGSINCGQFNPHLLQVYPNSLCVLRLLCSGLRISTPLGRAPIKREMASDNQAITTVIARPGQDVNSCFPAGEPSYLAQLGQSAWHGSLH